MEMDMVADMKVDKVADVDINMEIHFGERVGHRGWLIWPKLFRLGAYPACASSKLCELIFLQIVYFATRILLLLLKLQTFV